MEWCSELMAVNKIGKSCPRNYDQLRSYFTNRNRKIISKRPSHHPISKLAAAIYGTKYFHIHDLVINSYHKFQFIFLIKALLILKGRIYWFFNFPLLPSWFLLPQLKSFSLPASISIKKIQRVKFEGAECSGFKIFFLNYLMFRNVSKRIQHNCN